MCSKGPIWNHPEPHRDVLRKDRGAVWISRGTKQLVQRGTVVSLALSPGTGITETVSHAGRSPDTVAAAPIQGSSLFLRLALGKSLGFGAGRLGL